MAKNIRDKNFAFHAANGSAYEVCFVKPNSKHYGDADGTCADPKGKTPKIYINPYLTKQSELNTCIHEFTHAFFWDKSEKEVYKFANTLTKFLYTYCKWRKLENEKPEATRTKRRPKKRLKRNRKPLSKDNRKSKT